MFIRVFDVVSSALGLVATSPVLVGCMVLIWRQDGYSPFYVADRTGRDGRVFRMVKLRSMIKGADRTGVDSTGARDPRITPLGHAIRRYKLDELPQLWNVLKGDMSLVGPRPNVPRETDLYTAAERHLLDVRPGITDIASIVFADEGDILKDQPDPDLAYNQLIRPWKSRLGLLYVERRSLRLNAELIVLTVIGIVSRRRALAGVARLLRRLGAPDDLCRVALRVDPLRPSPPPGADSIVVSRQAAAQ